MNIEQKVVASMQGLSVDAINKANGGHIGSAIDMCPIMFALIGKKLKFYKDDPKWISRDRLILSAGHASMSFYSMMHFMNLLSIEDIKNHKKMNSKTPSHPEIDAFDFVDASTGPLGQGIAMGVGMAIAEKKMSIKINKGNYKIIDNYTYVISGDGCLQEGVALEALQLAGTLKLNKFILIHDFNKIQLDSPTNITNNIDFIAYFKALNFNTIEVQEPTINLIEKAIDEAKNSDKPTYIMVHNTIAPHTPFENSPKGHSGTLTTEQTLQFKKNLGLENMEPFNYDEDVYTYCAQLWNKKKIDYDNWVASLANHKKDFPWIHSLFNETINNKTNYDFSKIALKQDNLAIRDYLNTFCEIVENYYPFLIGGSADLGSSTKIQFLDYFYNGGQKISYGVREFAMSAINNGINLYDGLKTIDATFLVFADYAKATLRLGSQMKLPAVHIYSHDSYQVGGDGKTHQPIEQLTMLRSIPNLLAIRPCDKYELYKALNFAYNQNEYQIAIIASRQNLKTFNKHPKGEISPAYFIDKNKDFDISILATGSEVELAHKVSLELKNNGVVSNVISVPILQNLINNDKLAKKLMLNKKPIFIIEASNDPLWYKLSKYNKVDGHFATDYGYSDDGQIVYEYMGFTVDNIINKINKFLKNKQK
ncbi:transketolase-like TK C-terminal-containing protein [Mycoplasmopsis primatum]|uniref:transketolase-like TK C-terminal-containing protein n=1 Tax=Mycoplasmopsis primatum TaxID=55604 RepID=UPI000497035E|nr:1-deoxy-D-xylulose-5-phosphate synthase N-terminal domain-containing protein [Mycoplasmopsis primatum]